MRTYAPKKVQVIYNGRILTGFMDGTFVKCSQNADDFTEFVGADGEGARIASSDESGMVEVTLMSTSASNDYLSQQRALDKQTNQNTGTLLVKDGSGRSLHQATEAWLKRSPDKEYADGKSGCTWTIVTTKLQHFVGGNG